MSGETNTQAIATTGATANAAVANRVGAELANEFGSALNQYLTFVLADQEYGVDILRVQEIRGWDRVSRLPNTPKYLRGVMNLRGVIVPVIDLRRRFEMAEKEYSKTTVVVVLKVQSEDKERTMGFVVDAVSDVCSVSDEQLQAPPDASAGLTKYVKSLATVDSKMVVLLDVDRLVNPTAEAAGIVN